MNGVCFPNQYCLYLYRQITGQGFESHFVHIQEDETVQWTYKNGDSEVPCYLQEIG